MMKKISENQGKPERVLCFLTRQAPPYTIGPDLRKGVHGPGFAHAWLLSLGPANNIVRCRDHSHFMDQIRGAQIHSAICPKSHSFPVTGMGFEFNSESWTSLFFSPDWNSD